MGQETNSFGAKQLVNQANRENAVGYCHYYKHRGFMSIKLVKLHKCLEKNCPYLHKYEHPIWEKKNCVKVMRKMRKLLLEDDAEKIAEYIGEKL